MSSDAIAIRVQNIGKCFERYDAPRDRLKQFVLSKLQGVFGCKRKKYFKEFWALQDVSFEIPKGETFGVIGRNGAGKSTLLQILCGTLSPSHGTVEVNGRVAALLELGAGFNAEFTGRENVYMNASVLGLTEHQIAQRFERIVEFADIGDFLDQPVKTYSSGMYVRLAFAVVIHVDADILIVDEALAVGDIAFQAKCMGALRRLMDDGATVLFVSHDTSSVRNLCSQVLWLEAGAIRAQGDPESIIGQYIAQAHVSLNTHAPKARGDEAPGTERASVAMDTLLSMQANHSFAKGWRRYGDGRAQVRNIMLLDAALNPSDHLVLHEKFRIRILVHCYEAVHNPAVGFSFRDLKGNQVVSSLTTNYRNMVIQDFDAGRDYIVEIDGTNILSQGVYTICVGIESVVDLNRAHEFVDVVENVLVFQSNYGSDPHDIFPGMVWNGVGFCISPVVEGCDPHN